MKTSNSFLTESPYYKLIEDVLWYIHEQKGHENKGADLSLSAIAKRFKVSEFYLQRIFKRWVGISPSQYIRYLKFQNAKTKVRPNLRSSNPKKSNLAMTAEDSGFSSSSRLHDLFVKIEAVTPLQYRQKGKGLEIAYGFHATAFGKCLIGVSDRGICFLSFLKDEGKAAGRDALEFQKSNWENATFKEDPGLIDKVANKIFEKKIFVKSEKPITLFLKGTNFQIKVWEALLKIGLGETSSYKEVATSIGSAGAVRAVGSACGRNDLAFLIPCHRVLTSAGGLGGYRWGEKRKLAILEWEKIRATSY